MTTRKARHRHQLHGGDAQVAQVVEALDQRLEGALAGGGADVQLVDDQLVEAETAERRVGPLVHVAEGKNLGRAVHAERL